MAPEKNLSMQYTVPSADGTLIATVQPGRLVIRSATTSTVLTTYRIPHDAIHRCKHIRWSRPESLVESASQLKEEEWLGTKNEPVRRILLSDDDNIRVYDPANIGWKATISSASSNLGVIANVAFGFSPNEVLVFSEFGVKLTIWSLVTSRGVEIRDPKYNVACYSYRPKTGHLALLTRGGVQDMMLILKRESYEVLRSVELGTVDAQIIQWSTDGRWIAVCDAASAGYKVLNYTADGQLFKTWTRERGSDVQLGVKSIRWMKEALAIGDYNDEVILLKKDTFTPMGVLPHLPTISTQSSCNQKCWEEQIDAAKQRDYTRATHPVNPPNSASLAKPNTVSRHGVSVITVNTNNSLLATRSDTWPTTVWIWSLSTRRLITALIHHSPIKQIEWHPKIDDLLLIHCTIAEPVVHVWKNSWDTPKAFSLPFERAAAASRLVAAWLQAPASDDVVITMLSSSHDYATAHFNATDGSIVNPIASLLAEPEAAALSMGTGPEDMFDEGHSLDFSPVKISNGIVDLGGGYEEEGGFGMTGESVDDTFHYRRNIKAGV